MRKPVSMLALPWRVLATLLRRAAHLATRDATQPRAAVHRALAFALLVSLPGSALAADRFALIVGNNEGGPRRAKLWFAEQDAERFASTLRELGDFDASNVTVLKGAKPAELKSALTGLETAIRHSRAEGHRTLLVFYFSGHAGAGALELGADALELAELKALVEGSAADVKVAIVDACESGALTQVKGARPSAGLDFALPTDDSARGVAYVASTAVGETAQESAAIGGSFFTFHLEAALRGAADANGDGQVSLNEAFQYTASRTITHTTATEAGPQHPTYNFRMAGRGDVVLADLRRARARVTLGGAASAAYVISTDGRLVAEAPGGTTLALPAGTYRVEKHVGSEAWGGPLVLAQGDAISVGELPKLAAVRTRGKGGDEPPASLTVGAGVGIPVLFSGASSPGLGVSAGAQTFFGRWGLRAAFGYEDSSGQLVQLIHYRLQTVTVSGALLRRIFDGRLQLDLGLQLGGGWTSQSLATGSSVSAISGLGGGVATLGLAFGRIVPQLSILGGARVFKLDGSTSVQGLASAMIGLGVEL